MTQSELCVSSFGGLLKELGVQSKTFIREEVQLVKTEISEKVSHLGKNAISLAIGGLVAYGGVMVFVVGLGLLLAFLFQKLGLDTTLACFLGLGAIGLLVSAIGTIFLLKGIKAISKESLAPQRTLETIHYLKGDDLTAGAPEKKEEPKDERSSAELEDAVLATENRLGETLEELGRRVTLVNFRSKAKKEVRTHPYRWGLVAMVTGFIGSVFVKRKLLPGR
jgi:hypothetical protein